MKSYTYPINYTEMCPYDVTVVGTTCLLADASNRLTISKLDSKESIIGKTIYLGMIVYANNNEIYYTISAIISSINKNIINIDRESLLPGPLYYVPSEDISYYQTHYYPEYTDARNHIMYSSNRDILLIGNGISELSYLPDNLPSYMHMFGLQRKLLPSLCSVHSWAVNAISGKIELSINITIDNIPIEVNHSYIKIQSSEWSNQNIKNIIWEGELIKTTELHIEYAFILTIPQEVNRDDGMNIIIKTTINNIELYEHICQTKKQPVIENKLTKILRIGAMYNHAIIGDPLYND